MREVLRTYNNIIKEDNKIYHAVAKKFGLSDSAFWILYDLREGDKPLTQSELCQSLCQPKQTINSALKKLEADGYIELMPSRDKRSKDISLTSKGIVLANQTVDKIYALELEAMASLSALERGQLISVCKHFTSSLYEKIQEIL